MSNKGHSPNIQMGYKRVLENKKKFGMNKDCRECKFYLFEECQNAEVTEHDFVEDYGRTYCGFFEQK